MLKFKFRPSSLKERGEFYEKEFKIHSSKRWLKNKFQPQLYVIDVGAETGIAKNRNLTKKFINLKTLDIYEVKIAQGRRL